MSSSTHSNLVPEHLYSLSGEGDRGRSRLTRPGAAGERMKTPVNNSERETINDKFEKKKSKKKKKIHLLNIWVKFLNLHFPIICLTFLMVPSYKVEIAISFE